MLRCPCHCEATFLVHSRISATLFRMRPHPQQVALEFGYLRGALRTRALILKPTFILFALGAEPVCFLGRATARLYLAELPYPSLLACLKSKTSRFEALTLLAMIIGSLAQLAKLVVTVFENAVHPMYGLRKGLAGFRL